MGRSSQGQLARCAIQAESSQRWVAGAGVMLALPGRTSQARPQGSLRVNTTPVSRFRIS
jgi:hypothetical protein